MTRFAPAPDPSLVVKFYERTPEQQATLGFLANPSQMEQSSDRTQAVESNTASHQTRPEPHGSVGAVAGHRAIAQSNSAEIAETLFRYSAPEEVRNCKIVALTSKNSINMLLFYVCDFIG